MPIYKALILNREINLNYEYNQKEILIEAVNTINSKLKNLNVKKEKISDSKLLSFLAIKLQADILELLKNKKSESQLENKIDVSLNENLKLKSTIFELKKQKKSLEDDNEIISKNLQELENQINNVINLLKSYYNE
tara:strand:- start:728 stop:1135 length:408 start_codon:yes stop_codon:yes gene_type:complete